MYVADLVSNFASEFPMGCSVTYENLMRLLEDSSTEDHSLKDGLWKLYQSLLLLALQVCHP